MQTGQDGSWQRSEGYLGNRVRSTAAPEWLTVCQGVHGLFRYFPEDALGLGDWRRNKKETTHTSLLSKINESRKSSDMQMQALP
jgi:hypothetical protein